ncbi:ATP synthase epsilon chain, sodium ion specific [Roseimaritima multifibrata]|uniref:ATP synthase epsilon chain n=1 Tax=Roseimaritima multifibrata TaxID=1930274 RepID=A0A517M8Y4_9BACT|nr:F0F1 ATP synthase subunit epsilon [Roseimaritima multifibrata]QDS91345.1 ATP synthase epsilon chain, sodium ion specific [Roseimaritima multifibrata]
MSIRCLVVTPERTEVDREVDFLTLPMFDGELGIGKDRAAMIGRLGYGRLKLKSGGEVTEYFIDGGFAQVEENVVSVLTGRAIPISELQSDDAKAALEEALALPAGNADMQALKETAVMRARGMTRTVAGH